jgi:hypothetical protein
MRICRGRRHHEHGSQIDDEPAAAGAAIEVDLDLGALLVRQASFEEPNDRRLRQAGHAAVHSPI